MITITALADEIADDLATQMDVCEANGIAHIDVRAIDGRNVSSFSVAQARQYCRQLRDRGFGVPCLASPVGKIRMDEDYQADLDVLKRCFELAREFEAPYLRVFSFYASAGKDIADQRDQVLERVAEMTALAEQADVVLALENERDLYGGVPGQMLDVFEQVNSDHMVLLFDPANFVLMDVAPYDDGWAKGLAELTGYIHVKDAIGGPGDVCVPFGEGAAQLAETFADIQARGWSGCMSLEPHLAGGGKFSGFTGPKLFGQSVSALRKLLTEAGLAYD